MIFYKNFLLPVKMSVLPNGLTVITVEQEGAEDFTASIGVRAGSYHDVIPGTAHFLEHEGSRGPKGENLHPALECLQEKGVREDPCTGYFFTQYSLHGLLEDKIAIMKSLFELVFCCTISQKACIAERGSVLEEEEQDRDDSIFRTWYYKMLYPAREKMHHPILGNADSIKQITPAVLAEFHERLYHAKNMAFIASGGVKHEEIMAYAQKIPLPEKGQSGLVDGLMPSLGQTWLYRGQIDSQIKIIFAEPRSLSPHQRYCLKLITYILADTDCSLLWNRLRGQQSLVYAFDAEREHYPEALFTIWVKCNPQKFEKISRHCMAALQDLCSGNFSDKLFNSVLAKRKVALAEQKRKPCHLELAIEDSGILNMWLRGSLGSADFFKFEDFLKTVNKKEIIRVAKDVFGSQLYSIMQIIKED